ncbi:MAG: arginase family protein [Jannaschia sp.]
MADAPVSFKLVQPPGLAGAPFGTLEDLRPSTPALCGYFCDNLGLGPPGARFLARQIRYVSPADADLGGAIDLGDLNVFPLEPEKHADALLLQLQKIAGAGAVPVVVGGDDSALGIIVKHAKARLDHRPALARLALSGLRAPVAADVLALDLAGLDDLGADAMHRRGRDMITVFEALTQAPLAVALFGLAPALDHTGLPTTRLACDILSALVLTLTQVRAHAVA